MCHQVGRKPEFNFDDQVLQHAVLLMDAYSAAKGNVKPDIMFYIGLVALQVALKMDSSDPNGFTYQEFEEQVYQGTEYTREL